MSLRMSVLLSVGRAFPVTIVDSDVLLCLGVDGCESLTEEAVGVFPVHWRFTQPFFNLPGPPNFFLSLQNLQVVQSDALHP